MTKDVLSGIKGFDPFVSSESVDNQVLGEPVDFDVVWVVVRVVDVGDRVMVIARNLGGCSWVRMMTALTNLRRRDPGLVSVAESLQSAMMVVRFRRRCPKRVNGMKI